MAKKKPAGSTRTAAFDGASEGTAASARTSHQPPMSSDAIGDVAGRIWIFLSDEGPQSLAAIKKSAEAPGDLAMAAVGWLAREDKLQFHKSGRTVKVSLR